MTDFHRNLTKSIVARNLQLLRMYNLVQWSSGNISARFDDKLIIKPSGIPYHSDDLVAENMVAIGMDGVVLDDYRAPSVDTPIHLGVYRRRLDVNAIVHTHSTYATAFAVAGECIPPVSTMAADVFGGPVPCSIGVFLTDPDRIATVIAMATIHSPAVLLHRHGVFTVGKSIEEAVKVAVIVEEVAKVAFLARQLGWTTSIPAGIVADLHKRHQEGYGQDEPA